jgi:hypothetical protein
MDNRKPRYSLQEIANWHETNEVTLPTVQRGFVWRPFQIENLWDSILRGYPLGSFVLFIDENLNLQLLDGQQRATSISLGFANETFKESLKFYSIFIDLERPKEDDSRKFIFRVITRSHPWGYSKQDNTKTLTKDSIRNAMNLYEVEDPLGADLDEFFPYDSVLPIPLSYFLEAAIKKHDTQQLVSEISNWKHWPKIIHRWLSAYNIIESDSESQIIRKVTTIYEAVKRCLNNQYVPALYLNLQDQTDEADHQDYGNPDKVANTNEDISDEIETMFVRLNAGGTPLTGEELNYSILKAHISSETQKKLEEACKLMFRPARFITITYRLYQQQKKVSQADALTMRIKPKQFQRSIINESKEFEEFLISIIENKFCNGKSLLEYARQILAYSDEQSYALPYLLYSKISESAPELMFLLLYRIKHCGDTFQAGSEIHRRMLGMMCLMLWLGRGETLKDHSKLLSNIWPLATKPADVFWSEITIQRARINDVLLPFPSLDGEDGILSIQSYKTTEKLSIVSKYRDETGDSRFLGKMIYNKDLLLFAQRHFLEHFFRHKEYFLDDTCLPFDWDHISADNFVRSKWNIPEAVRHCYYSIGNFRAWPYALNRMDSDNSPAKKFRPLDPKIVTNEAKLASEREKWERFVQTNQNVIKSTEELSDKMLEWSFCSENWKFCDVHCMRDDWREVVRLINNRNISILEEWYKEHRIEFLIPNYEHVLSEILDKRRWKTLPVNNDDINVHFDLNETEVLLSSECLFENQRVHFYIYYNKVKGPVELIRQNAINMGILDIYNGNMLSQIKNRSEYKIDNNNKWIEGNYTLMAHNAESYKVLVKQMNAWLINIPFPSHINSYLSQEFLSVINSKFKAIS